MALHKAFQTFLLDNDILHVQFSNPENFNALNNDTFIDLKHIFSTLQNTIKCIILTSKGKHFTSGLSLKEPLYE